MEELSLKFFRYSLDSLKNSPPLFCLLAKFFYLGPKNVPSLSHSHSLSPSLFKARSFTHTFFLSLPFSHALNLSLPHFFTHRLFYRSENSLTLSLALSFSPSFFYTQARLSTLSLSLSLSLSLPLSLRLNLACTHALSLFSRPLVSECKRRTARRKLVQDLASVFASFEQNPELKKKKKKKLVFLKKSKNFDEPKF